LVARSRAAALDSRDYMFAASHTSVISPKTVNELRFQVASREQSVNSLDPTCNGECDREDEGGPTLEVTGVASVGRQRFTPQPRENVRYQILDTVSYYTGKHQLKAGLDFNHVDNKNQSLPLHFGGRYILQALQLPLVPGLPPFPVSAIQGVALGLPAAYVQGYGNSAAPYKYKDISLFAQDDWRITSQLTVKAGVRYQKQYWDEITYNVAGFPGSYTFPQDSNNLAPRVAVAWDPIGDKKTSVHAAYGIFFDNHITGISGITKAINGENGVRTIVVTAPIAFTTWASPGHRVSEERAAQLVGGAFPSLEISIDPGLETPYAHHVAVGVDRELPGQLSVSGNFVYVRGFKQ
ncbi:MAG: TonB-dependent receptor domain-containing protein, partial [Acidimicrobiia bacterium]